MPPPPTVADISDKLFINNMSIKQFNLFIGTVLLLFSGIFLLATIRPDSYITTIRPASSCVPWVFSNLGIPCDTFTLDKNPIAMIDIADLTPANKFVTLDIMPVRKNPSAQVEATVKLEVSAYTIQDNDLSDVSSPDTDEYTLDCSDSDPICEFQTILTLKSLKYKHYYLVVKFDNGQDLSSQFQDIAFRTTTLNTSYKSYVFVVKFLFLLVTIAAFLYYMFKSFGMKKEQFSKDLKSLELLFPVLLLFNEPFTSQIFGGVIYSWIATAAFVAGSALMLKFWICLMNDVLGPSSTVFVFRDNTLKLYLYVYCGVTWMAYVVYQGSIHPSPTTGFLFGSGFFFNLLAYASRIIILVPLVALWTNKEAVIQANAAAGEREKFLFWYSTAFYSIFVVLIMLGGLSPINYDGTKMLLFSGISTLYVISSAYLYLVNKNAGETAPAGTQGKGPYFNADNSPEFAPQAKSQGDLTGRIGLKDEGIKLNQEIYPPEIKAEEDF